MEEIEHFLKEDEEILWKTNYEDNIIELEFFFLVVLLIILILISFILFTVVVESKDIIPIIFVIILFSPVYGLCIGVILKESKEIKKKGKATQCNFRQLSRYQNIYLLTNKRWIQKDYERNLNIDENNYSKDILEKHFDIVFVNLKHIKAIVINRDEYFTTATFDFYENIVDENYSDLKVGFLVPYLPEDDFKAFIKMITNKLSYRKVKENEDGVYYHKE